MSEALFDRLGQLAGNGAVERDPHGLPRVAPDSEEALARVCSAAHAEGWRIRTRSAMKLTTRWTTQKRAVATTMPSAEAETSSRSATDSTMPMKIPTSEERTRIPRRASTARSYATRSRERLVLRTHDASAEAG